MKQFMPARTMNIQEPAIVPIQKDTSLDPVYDQQLLKLEIHLFIVAILHGLKDYCLQFVQQ